MIEIKGLPGTVKNNFEAVFDNMAQKIYYLRVHTKREIKTALFKIGKGLRKRTLELIDRPKSGNVYRIRIGGREIIHVASAPGEAPAIITGRLRRSIRYKVIGGNMLEFASYDVPYARELEYIDLINQSGQARPDIEPRPFLSAAFKQESALFGKKITDALITASML